MSCSARPVRSPWTASPPAICSARGRPAVPACAGNRAWRPERPGEPRPTPGPLGSALRPSGLAEDAGGGARPAGRARGGEAGPLVGAVAERLDPRLAAPAQGDGVATGVDL